MKQMFPILVAIIATTLVLVFTMARDQRKWSELEKKEKTTRLGVVAVGGVILLAGVLAAFLRG